MPWPGPESWIFGNLGFLCWIFSLGRLGCCTSASRGAALGVAPVFQLAATNARQAIAKETCLMHVAELIVLPILKGKQAAQTPWGSGWNFGSPILHSRPGLLIITWYFTVRPRGVWQSACIWYLGEPRMTSTYVLCIRAGQRQSQQSQACSARHGVTQRCKQHGRIKTK